MLWQSSFLWATKTLMIPEECAVIIDDLLCIRLYFVYIQSPEALVSICVFAFIATLFEDMIHINTFTITGICSELY